MHRSADLSIVSIHLIAFIRFKMQSKSLGIIQKFKNFSFRKTERAQKTQGDPQKYVVFKISQLKTR